eukprot:TRINITY_DN2067_c0_g1_i1.p1 TRINITY_DN2067_c0_g1~~TRINITY_DN2067_c0_g1_i1.p1  ORF type:complete len:257 (-),score=-49.76 TRINITY_DN2067_c0_g1_i1:304-1074(-)
MALPRTRAIPLGPFLVLFSTKFARDFCHAQTQSTIHRPKSLLQYTARQPSQSESRVGRHSAPPLAPVVPVLRRGRSRRRCRTSPRIPRRGGARSESRRHRWRRGGDGRRAGGAGLRLRAEVCRRAPGAASYKHIELIFIVLRGGTSILFRDGRRLVRVGVSVEEIGPCGVAAHLHALHLRLGPRVHTDGAHEADVDAEAAVRAGALETEEDAEGDRRPLRVLAAAVGAQRVARLRLDAAESRLEGGHGSCRMIATR